MQCFFVTTSVRKRHPQPHTQKAPLVLIVRLYLCGTNVSFVPSSFGAWMRSRPSIPVRSSSLTRHTGSDFSLTPLLIKQTGKKLEKWWEWRSLHDVPVRKQIMTIVMMNFSNSLLGAVLFSPYEGAVRVCVSGHPEKAPFFLHLFIVIFICIVCVCTRARACVCVCQCMHARVSGCVGGNTQQNDQSRDLEYFPVWVL